MSADAVAQTREAMGAGTEIIVQGALSHGGWGGRTDILRRVEIPSDLGDWSYEVIDTKLARETKGGTILQLCLYSDLLTKAQGREPEFMYVVPPWSGFIPQQYRLADYGAYYRRAKAGLEQSIVVNGDADTYPDPKEHCEICRWRLQCDTRRRADDHLCLVAGISKVQIGVLKKHDVSTASALADLPLPIPWKPERGSLNSFDRIREQARIQVQAREAGDVKFELLDRRAIITVIAFNELLIFVANSSRRRGSGGCKARACLS
jgi:predicted RecB family nuclease